MSNATKKPQRSRDSSTLRLRQLEREVASLKRKIGRSQGVVGFIASFAPEPFEVVEPIPVTIQQVEGGYVASFLEANINASGETQHGAFVNLKDLIIANFEKLAREPVHTLGKGPARRREVLNSVMCKKGAYAANPQRAGTNVVANERKAAE